MIRGSEFSAWLMERDLEELRSIDYALQIFEAEDIAKFCEGNKQQEEVRNLFRELYVAAGEVFNMRIVEEGLEDDAVDG